MTIAITAATGQLGRLTVEQLLTRVPASEIVAIVRDSARAGEFSTQGVTIREADYNDHESYTAALEGVTRLLLVSGNDFGHRTAQHTNVIEAAQHAGVTQVVYTSVVHADRSPLLVAPEHYETEQALIASGLDYVILRNGWYHENYVPALENARTSGTLVTSAANGRVASAARVDYATAAAVVLTTDGHSGRSYELTGDYAWNMAELAQTISTLIGKTVEVRLVSPQEQSTILTEAGVPEFGVNFTVKTDQDIDAGALDEVNGVLSTLIGRPATTLSESLRSAL